VLLLDDSALLVVDCALFDALSVASSAIYIYIVELSFFGEFIGEN
jgi:hypothetical protein